MYILNRSHLSFFFFNKIGPIVFLFFFVVIIIFVYINKKKLLNLHMYICRNINFFI